MALFIIAFEQVIKKEGIYSNDPDDNGGETCFGISRKNFPLWDGWKEVDRLKKANGTIKTLSIAIGNNSLIKTLTKQFYKAVFWDFLKLDHVNAQALANELFDAAVNLGRATVAKYLQQSLNLLNNNGELYADLVADGSVGEKTLVALTKYLNTAKTIKGRTDADVVTVLLKAIDSFQTARYTQICQTNPSQEKYYFGWLKNR